MKPLPAAVLAGIAGAAAVFVLLVVGLASSCIWASPHPKMPISSRSITEVIKKPAVKQFFSKWRAFSDQSVSWYSRLCDGGLLKSKRERMPCRYALH